MRMLLAIIVCKILRFVGKLVGKGSSLPGREAVRQPRPAPPDPVGRKLPAAGKQLPGRQDCSSRLPAPS